MPTATRSKASGFREPCGRGQRAGAAIDVKQTLKPPVEELGFEAVDAGSLAQAHLLEPLARRGPGREIACRLMRRYAGARTAGARGIP